MKHLRSSARDLRLLMDDALTAFHICEPLLSFDDDKPVAMVRPQMEQSDFDVAGVRHHGRLIGYVRRDDLTDGRLGQFAIPFGSERQQRETTILSESASLMQALSCLKTAPFVFLGASDHVLGIITRGDLHKAPMRMWLFALVTLTEMQLLRLVRKYHPEEAWRGLLNEARLRLAEEMWRDRRRRNEAIDLADCLQFCDKCDIFLGTPRLLEGGSFTSKNQCRAFLKSVETLRNDLSHAQMFSAGSWPEIIALAERAEEVLRELEQR